MKVQENEEELLKKMKIINTITLKIQEKSKNDFGIEILKMRNCFQFFFLPSKLVLVTKH